MTRPRLRLASAADAVADVARDERRESMEGPDGPEGRALAIALAANLARLRARRHLELDDLAARSGIRRELLVRLEAGEAVPSLRAVWALATALRVPFGAIVALPGAVPAIFRVQRADRGRIVVSASRRVRSRALFPLGDPLAPEVYELTLAPGSLEEATAHAVDTWEHLLVARGALIVRAGDRAAQLGPGDSLFFRADVPHSYENPTATESVAHLVMSYA
jgi:transcriptional regulator with XRE-family HTH domain